MRKRIVLFIFVTSALVLTLAGNDSVYGFGTVNSPRMLNQRSEHERITRAALACPPGQKSNEGDCFEPNSMDQLAGTTGSFGTGTPGAVGAPDINEPLGHPEVHCDDGDFLGPPFAASYTRPGGVSGARAAITNCVMHMHAMFMKGRDDAIDLLKIPSFLNLPELNVEQADISTGCIFIPGYPRGNAKCNVLEDFGRMLHGAQDFYSHSNWADVADPGKPISIDNPPGLNQKVVSPLLALRDGAYNPNALPPGLITGYYKGFFTDKCPGPDGRVTHACLNKDEELITLPGGQNLPPTVFNTETGLLTFVTQQLTPRGRVEDNAQAAVDDAIAETKRQWTDFKAELIEEYGDKEGKLIISALTEDVPKVDLVFVIDTTGSMGPTIDGVKAQANSIVNRMTSPFRPVDFRIAVVDYKDLYNCSSDGYAARVDLGFSSDGAAITNAINGLSASGGCDTPESVYSGLMAAINLPWRKGVGKAIIQMGDAPPHDPEPTTGFTATSVSLAALAVDPAVVYPIDINGGAGPLLGEIATKTGGTVFTAFDSDEVSKAIFSVIDSVSAPDTTNHPPVATAGSDRTLECNGNAMTAVRLDGHLSSDADGDTLRYDWSAPGVTFDDAHSATPTGNFPYGLTTVTLTVSDGKATATAQVHLQVKPCIQINHGDAYTAGRNVTLALSYASSPSMMRLSNRPFTDDEGDWRPFAAEMPWRLTVSEGVRTVYVQFKSAAGVRSKVFSDSITLDTEKPIIFGVALSHTTSSSHAPTVRVTLHAKDRLSGIAAMKVSNTRQLSGAAWTPYKQAFDWTLAPLTSPAPAQRKVYVQVKDGAGNVSGVHSALILLTP